jgi:Tfp pilus assembly protein PilX
VSTPYSSAPFPARPSRGFALLITITLLAFLVLLLVSLASLTRVETKVAGNSQQLAQARQNALMALNIALGQLQKYTGPDQRVTATADIASAADGSRLPSAGVAVNTTSVNGTGNGLAAVSGASVQAGTRYWTGVWGRAGTTYATPAQSIYDETPSPVLLNWLVSGNEDRAFTVDASGLVSTSSSDARSNATTAPFTPGSPVDWAAAGLNPATPANWAGGGYANLQIQSSGQKAVLLVGPKTAGVAPASNGEAAFERYVVAPIKNIDVAASSIPGMGSAGTITVGRYAWWVGDEGVKASYTLVDRNPGQNEPGGSDADAAKSRLRLMTASRSGIELLPSFGSYPQGDASEAQDLNKIVRPPQVSLLDPSLPPETQQSHFHDLTMSSFGVLSNTLAGGLRQDLTHYFELSPAAWAASPLANQGIIPSPWSPNWSGLGNAPKWDWLYSFYNTNPSVATATLPVRPETPTEVGVTPILTQFRMMVFTDISKIGPLGTVNNIPAGTYNLPIRSNVAFVLANPYNVNLTIPANTYEFVLKNTWTGGAATNYPTQPQGYLITAHNFYGRDPANGKMFGHFVLIRGDGTSDKSMMDSVRFIVPAVSIPPGETCVLSVRGNNQVAGASGPPPASGSEDPVELQVNTLANPIGGKNNYFTAASTLDFTATERAYAWVYIHDQVYVTITLRKSGSGEILQQFVDGNLSKGGAALQGSIDKEVFVNTHIKFLAPARRNVDWSAAPDNLHYAAFAYARPFMDLNLRSATHDHTSVDYSRSSLNPKSYVYNPISYAGGFSKSNHQSPSSEFTQDLTPATWVENFSADTRSPVASKGIFFDFPRRTTEQPPVLSIGHLQHASLTADDWHPGTSINYQPAYAVGNSYSYPFVTRGQSVQDRTGEPANYYKAPSGPVRFFDMAYLLNTSLWDGYYFSGIPQSGNAFAPLNPRYTIYDGADGNDVRNPDAAAHLLTKGAFNINSTSHAAWVAVLGGLNRLRVNNDTTANGVPFPRTLWQPVENTQTGTSYTSSGTGDDAYAGYRRLNADEIGKLATEIVKRVRARGPFISLSHFINRSLVTASSAFNSSINDADTSGNLAATTVPMGRGLSGLLQAAIDSAASGINTFQQVGSDLVTANGEGAYGDRVLFAGEIINTTDARPYEAGEPKYNTGQVYFADKKVDLPNLDPNYNHAAPPGPQGRSSTGIPGWLLQGDLLQAIGPALSARSDTFVIRTYGEVVNPTDSTQTEARAWCEAVVQRVPEYVKPEADAPGVVPASLNSAENRTFGRAYKIVSFRWLSPSDI